MTPFTESFGWERPIEEIEVGDRVWAWNEETGESELAEVVRVFERETLEVYALQIGAGEVLETTDEHPFWVVGRGNQERGTTNFVWKRGFVERLVLNRIARQKPAWQRLYPQGSPFTGVHPSTPGFSP